MQLIYIFRSLLFYIGYVFGVVGLATFGIVASPFVDFQKLYYLLSRTNAFVLWWAKIACGIRYELRGKENIPNQACVVVCNHQSAWETYYIGLLFTPQATVLKQELIKIPVFGWALSKAKPIAIDRSKPSLALKQLLKQGKERLEQGLWVVIYPEGTRVRPGKTAKYNKGAAMLASSAGVAVLPVAHNAGKCWPAGQFIKRPGTIIIEIGEPMHAKEGDRNALHQDMENWIRSKVESF